MSRIIGLVSICFPAFEDHRDIPADERKFIEHIVQSNGLTVFNGWCDTQSAWWNLDQDWCECYAVIDTSWGNCKIVGLAQEDQKKLNSMLSSGRIVMMLRYVEGNLMTGEFKLTPHH